MGFLKRNRPDHCGEMFKNREWCGVRTVVQCSHLLNPELACFPNAKVYLLMEDVAIKAVKVIAADIRYALEIAGTL